MPLTSCVGAHFEQVKRLVVRSVTAEEAVLMAHKYTRRRSVRRRECVRDDEYFHRALTAVTRDATIANYLNTCWYIHLTVVRLPV